MYYFIGIKGAGMSSLAVIMKGLGYKVCGSDLEKHFFTEEELIKNNISMYPYDANNIKKDMIIIKGASIKENNVELIRARELGLEIIEYNEMVGKLTEEFKTICVAGCHGKTTTTSMIAHVFEGIKGINYLIGDGRGAAKRENEFFVLESCEYCRHFLAYQPYYAIVLNIEMDHVDYFKDMNDVILAYSEFANKASKMVIANGDDKNTHLMKLDKEIIFFGLGQENDVRAIDINYKTDGIEFTVLVHDSIYGKFDLPIFGEHQLIDALAVISVCYLEGLSSNQVNEQFKSFTGARRRFSETKVGDNIIIDDYAHHPSEIKSTLKAIKQKYPNKKIVAIFQPHTFSRTKEFASEIAEVLSLANASYVMDIHPAREKQEDFPNITKDTIINDTKNCYSIGINDAYILNEYVDTVFIFMSPNDISKLENDLIKLKSNK